MLALPLLVVSLVVALLLGRHLGRRSHLRSCTDENGAASQAAPQVQALHAPAALNGGSDPAMYTLSVPFALAGASPGRLWWCVATPHGSTNFRRSPNFSTMLDAVAWAAAQDPRRHHSFLFLQGPDPEGGA